MKIPQCIADNPDKVAAFQLGFESDGEDRCPALGHGAPQWMREVSRRYFEGAEKLANCYLWGIAARYGLSTAPAGFVDEDPDDIDENRRVWKEVTTRIGQGSGVGDHDLEMSVTEYMARLRTGHVKVPAWAWERAVQNIENES